MKKYKIGDLVRVGGKLGGIMEITKINGKDMILEDEDRRCTFYYHVGDCTLIPVKRFEQLKLF